MNFVETTRIFNVKCNTLMIARATQPVPQVAMLTNHPFVSSIFWYDMNATGNGEEGRLNYKDLSDPAIYAEWVKMFEGIVDRCETLKEVYNLWRAPYKLTFMKFCGEFLSEKDFAELLADAWVTEENPNMDVNVSQGEALKMFRKAPKEYLMQPEELAYYQALPEELDVYRGVAVGRKYLGLSWTDDVEKARWFMHRFDTDEKKGRLLKAHVRKDKVIAYFNSRNEKELVLDIYKCRGAITPIG